MESTYSVARSESASEYSRRAWDSTASLDDDLIQSRPVSPSPSSRTQNTELGDDDYETLDTGHTEELLAAESSLQPRMSVLGPKTRFVTRAPWEPGGDDLEEEGDVPEAETRSLFGGRGRSKKPKESNKQRGFPASFVPRASSSSNRPSVDVSTPTSSSSGGRFRPSVRPGSVGTCQTNESDALPFPSPRFEKPVAPSLRSVQRNTMDEQASSHPYANPDVMPSHPYADGPSLRPSKPTSGEHPPHISNPVPTREIPPPPMLQGLPQKMAPWQYTPSSPTFQLVSLQEAQALKARQRQVSLPTSEGVMPRSRAISGPSHKSSLPLENTNSNSGSVEDGPAGSKTLKGRRSLMGLFARGREKDRSPNLRPESPPPVPLLPSLPSPSAIHGSPAQSPMPTSTPVTPQPYRQGSSPSIRSQKRVPPPSLNVVVTSAESQARQMMPPPPIPNLQKSATPPPSMPSRTRPPSKQPSTGTLSPIEGSSSLHKPNSAPSNIQGFTSLSLRPVSTMFSSMPSDYLASAVPPPSGFMSTSTSTSGHFSTQSPTTPSLWSSRSESMSTGSSEVPPLTPGGLLHSGSLVDGSANSLTILQKQVYGARDAWKVQIADLEAQVRALKAEVVELRKCPCPSCGFLGGGSSCTEKGSVVNRPRAKTGAGPNRVLFGGE